ncbi:MAG: hypothetical protein KDA70_13920 [Planctomycetaceae bacterium]|nr:hypothetical protein [Planctomycetaceae bacterium]
MKYLFLLLIFSIAGCSEPAPLPPLSEKTVDGIRLQPRTLLDGDLQLLIPEGFTLMSEKNIKLKYPSERRPTLVFSNVSGSVNVAINYTTNSMSQGRINRFHRDLEEMFQKQFPTATWYQSGVADINGRKWALLNLTTPAADIDVHNLMVGTTLNRRLLLVTFNVTKDLEEMWLNPGQAVIQSLSVRD